MNPHDSGPPRPVDWLLFLCAPVFFSTNLIFGRGITGDIAPFTTAFIRWFGSALIVFPFLYADRRACMAFIRAHTGLWLWLGVLGMGICGGFVYWALTMTTASNGTLIYTTSSLFIILLQWLLQGRAIRPRELAGMAIAFVGVGAIVFKGSWETLAGFRFNLGDFGILIAAISFALYSMTLRRPEIVRMKSVPLFGLLAMSGAIVLSPLALYEFLNGAPMPDSGSDLAKLAGVILFASLAAFLCFQHSVRVFGPAMAGITLYLMPPVSIVMAVVFLGEQFHVYHAAGIVLVMSGLLLASFPAKVGRKAPTTS